jgi:hypothetical protein
MSPAASIRRHISSTVAAWRGWVVRTTSSARAFSELLGGEPLALGGALHLLAVLVHAGHEQHIEAVEPLEARESVGRDALIGVTDMGGAIRIRNGGGDHEGRTLSHGQRSSALSRCGKAGCGGKAAGGVRRW